MEFPFEIVLFMIALAVVEVTNISAMFTVRLGRLLGVKPEDIKKYRDATEGEADDSDDDS